jgi:hypothetical protein
MLLWIMLLDGGMVWMQTVVLPFQTNFVSLLYLEDGHGISQTSA